MKRTRRHGESNEKNPCLFLEATTSGCDLHRTDAGYGWPQGYTYNSESLTLCWASNVRELFFSGCVRWHERKKKKSERFKSTTSYAKYLQYKGHVKEKS
jgi:hypothetical protein